ncbi:MAG: alpha/beta hydrolase [Gammaproteobacteria bacterium]|nr:alpha/beta hydrolase [Gammaproteobacteria bacterium]
MYQPIENPAITRHFVNLGDSQVHIRLAGSGPPLVLLHQSPTSSAEMATDIEACARFFTVIGIDMPGYGLSDPLPDDHPEVSDLAAAVERVVTALGLDDVLLYGFHTGAIVAFEFACRYPERCAAAVVNGLVCMEGDELADLLRHYNVLPEVTAEGAHLPWLWARLRDQTLFFPWYRKTPDARMALDLHDGQYLHPYLVDFLRAKEGGRPGYQAAFRYPTRERLPQVDVPVYLVNFAPDPLTPHPERAGEFPACVKRAVFDDFAALQESTLDYLRGHAPADVDIPRESVGAFDGVLQKAVVNTEAGSVFLRHSARGDESPLLLLHDAGSSSAALDSLARRLVDASGGGRQVLLMDLPGHGETDELQLPLYSAGAISILIGLALRELGIAAVDVMAMGASALIATALGHSDQIIVDRMVLIDPWFFDADERERLSATYAPKLMPGDYGQHLLEAWYFARDSELYWPWNEPHPQNALTRVPDIDPDRIQARTVDVLKAGVALPRLVRELLTSDPTSPFAELACDVAVCARAGSGHEARAERAAATNPHATYHRIPADEDSWHAALAKMLKLSTDIGHNSDTATQSSA